MLEPEGLVVSAGAPAELDALRAAPKKRRWRKIVKENNIKAD